MKKYSLDDIRKIVDETALKIDAPSDLLPNYGKQIWDDHPYIDVDSHGFMFYINAQRRQEYERRKTDNIDDLLYWIFSHVTFFMACDYELKNRIENEDCRRLIFKTQAQMLGQLNDKWRQKENAEHQRILKSFPFDDFARARAIYWGRLRQQGLSETEIHKLVYKKYPEVPEEKPL